MSEERRAERVAWNESAFRTVNEHVEDVAEALGEAPEFVCECSDLACRQRLRVPVDEYERVRAHGARFLVAPGHERPEFERVIDDRGDWLVIEKTDQAGVAAAESDPRQP